MAKFLYSFDKVKNYFKSIKISLLLLLFHHNFEYLFR